MRIVHVSPLDELPPSHCGRAIVCEMRFGRGWNLRRERLKLHTDTVILLFVEAMPLRQSGEPLFGSLELIIE